jgi:hypothetical protein
VAIEWQVIDLRGIFLRGSIACRLAPGLDAQEFKFRDTTGFVATGTQQIPISLQDFDLFDQSMYIPYYALNFQATNGVLDHFVYVGVTFYIDNFQAGQTAPVLFQFRF